MTSIYSRKASLHAHDLQPPALRASPQANDHRRPDRGPRVGGVFAAHEEDGVHVRLVHGTAAADNMRQVLCAAQAPAKTCTLEVSGNPFVRQSDMRLIFSLGSETCPDPLHVQDAASNTEQLAR